MTDDLVAFLKARLDEDEQEAKATGALYPWVATEDAEVFEVCGDLNDPRRCQEHGAGVPNMCSDLLVASVEDDARSQELTQHIARWDPARVLAEVQAKRRIIDLLDPDTGHSVVAGQADREDFRNGWQFAVWSTLRLLALPYASHSDYRAAWSPDEVDA